MTDDLMVVGHAPGDVGLVFAAVQKHVAVLERAGLVPKTPSTGADGAVRDRHRPGGRTAARGVRAALARPDRPDRRAARPTDAGGPETTLVSHFGTAEQRQQLAAMGMVEGMTLALGKIDDVLAGAAPERHAVTVRAVADEVQG